MAVTVDSILKSTYSDFELIMVNDGSTDDSGATCDRCAAQDNRVRVIHKQNAGVAEARNSGLDAAKGDRIMFVDADDMIHPRMIEILQRALDSGEHDLAMVHGVKVREEEFQGIKPLVDDEFPEPVAVTRDDYMDRIYAFDYQYQVVWNKLYRKSLIDGLQFKNTSSEDLEWLNRMALRMQSAILVQAELYYYFQRHGSLMRTGVNQHYIGRVDSYLMCLNAIPATERGYRALCLKTLYSVMLLIRRKAYDANLKKEADECCAKVFKTTIKEFLGSDIAFASKVRSVIGYMMPRLYNRVVNHKESRARHSGPQQK